MPSVYYRDFQREDLEAVATVWLESWRSIALDVTWVPTQHGNRERIRHELENGWHVTVAAVGDQIIGFLACKPTEGMLDQLFVAPDMKGRGVGTGLLKLAMAMMPVGFRLRAAEANRVACAFYEARGLRRKSVEPHPTLGHATVVYVWP